MLDGGTLKELRQVQLYLSVKEAKELVHELQDLLGDPERLEHFHLFSSDSGIEISASIVTRAKLASGGYTREERDAFGKWKPET
jgi:hypothetical protein